MRNKSRGLVYLFIVALVLTSLSCNLASRLVTDTMPDQGGDRAPVLTLFAETPALETEPPPPPPTETPPPPPPEPTSEPTSEPEAAIREIPSCEAETCVLEGSFWLARPAGPGGRLEIDTSARFGNYRPATKSARHGTSMVNSLGTPVIAAADGTVVVAGDDFQKIYGLYKGMYGNFVILEHDLGLGEPVYTLYGYLNEISVSRDDQVQKGEQIGTVGASGDVTGSTLYFEVRYGKNEFDAVRNPELWMEARQGDDGVLLGALAGRVMDSQGKYVGIDNIVFELLAGPGQPAQDTFYAKTYAEKRLMGNDPWAENFALGDIPPGEYQISFYHQGVLIQRIVEVASGMLTLTTFLVP